MAVIDEYRRRYIVAIHEEGTAEVTDPVRPDAKDAAGLLEKLTRQLHDQLVEELRQRVGARMAGEPKRDRRITTIIDTIQALNVAVDVLTGKACPACGQMAHTCPGGEAAKEACIWEEGK